ncbi:FAD-binding oxidoreductase [Cereibacter sphaeroides]|nr:FAD-binding oxidoreductase [Cereibacter sphaeroides]
MSGYRFRGALPRHPGPCGWTALLPPRQTSPCLLGEASADVVVVGGGFAGLAAARVLTQADPTLSVMLLEAGEIGEGPAGRNSGFLIDLPHDVSAGKLGGDHLDAARRAITKNRAAIAIATGLNLGREIVDPCGRYAFSANTEGDRHLIAYAAQLDRLEEPHRLLSAAEVTALTGTESFTSALFTPGTVMIQPAAYVRALADALPCPVHEYSAVTAIARQGNFWRVTTAQGAVTAGKVILACNGHAGRFGLVQRRLMPVFTYASMTRAFDPSRLGGARDWAGTPALAMGTTLRRIRGPEGDRLLIRARYTYNPSVEVGDGTLARAGALHRRKLALKFPMLADVPTEFVWGGAMALTWNGAPLVEEIEPSLITALGCNGVGGTNATANGIVAAERVLGVSSDLGAAFAAKPRPPRIPPEPFATLGGKATLMWKEHRAGALA